MESTRLNLFVSPKLYQELEEIAHDLGISRAEVVRRALALIKVAYQGHKQGQHIGLVSDPKQLDTILVGIL